MPYNVPVRSLVRRKILAEGRAMIKSRAASSERAASRLEIALGAEGEAVRITKPPG